ncbi:MAG: hypothetical protein HGA31_01615 [Candidatus Moranbacteria bacterium]|nr:hypothetical protein [Candidatus Moranbacteria bacterium]
MRKKRKATVRDIINPATGKPDLTGAMRHAVEKLNRETDLGDGTVYHTLHGSMTERLKIFGFLGTHLPTFLLLTQEIGVLRLLREGKKTIWQVCSIDLFDGFLSPPEMVIERAILKVGHRHRSNTNTPRDNKPDEAPSPLGPKTLEAVAKIIAENDRLKLEGSQIREEINRLREEAGAGKQDEKLARMVRKLTEGT